MSMDFTEYRRRLGAEPRSDDPELRRARSLGPEFAAVAEEAERFEQLLERAIAVTPPADWLDELRETTPARPARARSARWPLALAAGLLLAVGAAGLYRYQNPHWDTVEAYVVDHYHHDGGDMLARGAADPSGADPADVQALFARFDMTVGPALQDAVGAIRICITPDGKGIHMVLNTVDGPATVIYMPATDVVDGSVFDFDDQRALLVALDRGGAAIVESAAQDPATLYALVQDSIRPLAEAG